MSMSAFSRAFQPSVCVGNVGQLATDLVLASAAAPRRVSAVSHPALLPVVGADPIDETDNDRLMTACEGEFKSAFYKCDQ